jgi:hypothetical protein
MQALDRLRSSARTSQASPRARRSRRLVEPLAFLLAAAAAGGCFAPSYHDGALMCSPGKVCPDGFHCAVDNTCWRLGEDPPAQHSVSIAVSAGGSVGDSGKAAHRATTSFGQQAGIAHSTTEHSLQNGVLASTIGP